MKTLYIIRHAKSSWDDPLLDDFSRPLNDRGKRDAPRMAKRLKEKNVIPDLMVTSPARRALGTCKRMAEVLGYADDKIKVERGLYNASKDEIREAIRSIKDKYDVMMIVGHNQGLTDFVNALGKQQFFNIPTCGVAAYELKIMSWKEIKYGTGKLLFYDFLKQKRTV